MTKFIREGSHGFAKLGLVGEVAGAIHGGYSKAGVWFETTPEGAESLPHGLIGKPSNNKASRL